MTDSQINNELLKSRDVFVDVETLRGDRLEIVEGELIGWKFHRLEEHPGANN